MLSLVISPPGGKIVEAAHVGFEGALGGIISAGTSPLSLAPSFKSLALSGNCPSISLSDKTGISAYQGFICAIRRRRAGAA